MSVQVGANRKKSPFERAVDAAPLAGKFLIKDTIVNFDTADDRSKTRNAIGAASLLAVMVAVHAEQARMGTNSLLQHFEAAMYGDAASIGYGSVDVAYVGINLAVATRQAMLLNRVGQKYKQWRADRKVIPEAVRRREKRPYAHKATALLGAAAFTITGQCLAIKSMEHAEQQQQIQVEEISTKPYSDSVSAVLTYTGNE